MGYEPLTWPDNWPPQGRWWRFLGWYNWGAVHKHIKMQLAARDPVSPEVWGTDPRRYALARFIGATIEEELERPRDRFVPDDPFEIVIWDEDLVTGEIIVEIEDELGVNIPEDDERLHKMTLGEAVDFLLAAAPEWQERWPESGAASLESRPCPTSATFWGLRQYVRRRFGVERERVRPETRLDDVVPPERRRKLDTFVFRRYGVAGAARLVFLGSVPFGWAWLAANALSAAAIWRFAGLSRHLVWLVPLQLPLCLLLYRVSLRKWHRGIATLGDLAKWILAERAKKRGVRGEPAPAGAEPPQPSTISTSGGTIQSM